ncbi:hypothetical protein [Sediminicola luteus]|nr:hypothetical protein [Sediminicola luteus]
MEYLILTALFLLLASLLYLCYLLLRWFFARKVRVQGLMLTLGLIFLGLSINHLFFKQMVFVQSQVYPDLYLVKNPVQDQTVLNAAIKQKILETVAAHGPTSTGVWHAETIAQYQLRFYEYTRSNAFHIFADAGTSYFLENKEDFGGFVSEELGMYTQNRLAEFYFTSCKNNSSEYCGDLAYFKEGQFDYAEEIPNLLPRHEPPKDSLP